MTCSEFNHVRDENDDCVLLPGTTPLPSEEACSNGEEYLWERTAYRQIPYSRCVDRERPDRGKRHVCPSLRSKGSWFWFWMLLWNGQYAYYPVPYHTWRQACRLHELQCS